MESPLEFHSLKPDNGVASPFGFGCADYSPGRCISTDRGFVLHGLYYTLPPNAYQQQNDLQFETGLRMMESCHQGSYPQKFWTSSGSRGRKAERRAVQPEPRT